MGETATEFIYTIGWALSPSKGGNYMTAVKCKICNQYIMFPKKGMDTCIVCREKEQLNKLNNGNKPEK